MFSTNFKKIGCSFAKIEFLKKIQDGDQDGGHVVKWMLP